MAEVTMPQRGKRIKYPPKIDFTPMVDLGFLLITFFIYTTTFSKPGTIDISMPSKEGTPAFIPETNTITIIPIQHHFVAYYEGALMSEKQVVRCPINVMHSILRRKKSEAVKSTSFGAGREVFVFIKPFENSKYGDVVALLDELAIEHIENYTIADLSIDEKNAVDRK